MSDPPEIPWEQQKPFGWLHAQVTRYLDIEPMRVDPWRFDLLVWLNDLPPRLAFGWLVALLPLSVWRTGSWSQSGCGIAPAREFLEG